MARNKSNDKLVFSWEHPYQLNYFAHLYGKNEEVEKFLRRHCANGSLENKTHLEVFEMIEEELGFPIP
ncbi:hypothetical protein [Saccharicrinis fermentans]|uniref:Uncharacterized protein n=1 Tax=Saccharicrinis fermentans DSM 9555 = JCM 21142 TaxID=869213 RepID=W7YLD6_9BACT|nr:hypothetical protein [Saccharicrinis fermentans]GAF03164.1 hypothetical protein JCM21142_41829 [Saccharicrinis fermentans DSM 9555 = JCM 21142]